MEYYPERLQRSPMSICTWADLLNNYYQAYSNLIYGRIQLGTHVNGLWQNPLQYAFFTTAPLCVQLLFYIWSSLSHKLTARHRGIFILDRRFLQERLQRTKAINHH